MPVTSADIECPAPDLEHRLVALRRLADLPRPAPVYHGGKPFYFGGPVQINSRFIGRRQELRHIAEDASRGQDVSLVGERRIGKSSLLWQLYLERRELLPDCLVGYVDLQGYGCHTQRGFLTMTSRALLTDLDNMALLRRLLVEEVVDDLCEDEVMTMPRFQSLVRALATEGEQRPYRPLLLVDEFEAMLQHRDEFDDVFFHALRDIAGRGLIAFVIASHQPLANLLVAEAKSKSSFANIFVQRRLSCLTPAEARELICQPNDRPFDEREIKLALHLGRNCPHLLQLACSEIYRAKYQSPPDLARVQREFPVLVENTRTPECTYAGESAQPQATSHQALRWLRPLATVGRAVRRVGQVWNEIDNVVIGVAVIVLLLLILLGVIRTPDLVTFVRGR